MAIDIEKLLSNCAASNGAIEARKEGLVVAAFPDTFAPSAFHSAIRDAMLQQPNVDEPVFFGTDWAFRHVDLPRVGSGRQHLSSFRMYCTWQKTSTDRREALRARFVGALIEVLVQTGILAKEIFVTYYGGGFQDVLADHEVAQYFTSHGVPPRNIVPLCGSTCLTNFVRRGEPAGPRCEVFVWKTNAEPVEVATFVTEDYMIGERSGILERGRSHVVGYAVGIERLTMVAGGHRDIVEIPQVQSIYAELTHNFGAVQAGLLNADIRMLVDGLRSNCVLRCVAGEELPAQLIERRRALERHTLRALQAVGGLSDLQLSPVISKILEACGFQDHSGISAITHHLTHQSDPTRATTSNSDSALLSMSVF